ncbi:MAG: ribonuclease J [Cyanobacteriota bacterium]|nr:ribonuclease J [Cyanobacteriota bacterium]
MSTHPARPSSKPTPVQLIPLGGEQEIGKNTWAFRYEDEIILLDAGLAFPDESMHGINIVLPDMTYVKENRDKIRGMVVTHGHEDHIGGIPYHLRDFEIPVIYGPKLALALLEEKLREAGLLHKTELRTVSPRQVVPLGKNFFVEFIRNTHSFADSFTVALHTPAGVVIQTGDFKIDHTPVDGEYFDLQRLAEHGEKGVLCLISDSTNAEVPGYTPSEASVIPGLSKAIGAAKGRAIITTFASSVHRINIILQIAEQQGRVVSLLGRSMINVVAHARRLGYIRCKDETLQPMHVINHMKDADVIILTTGSQGEPSAALTRIANGEHPQLQIKRGDTVIISANPIPGNVIPVSRVIDKLMSLGAHVVYGKEKGIHVSGHGAQEEQKLMLALTKPKFFVPTHGEYRMLVKHAETAISMGMPPENIVIVNNGDVVQVTEDKIAVVDRVASGIQLIDGSHGAGVVVDKVMQERQQIAKEGLVTVGITVDQAGKLVYQPQVKTFGLAGDPRAISANLLQPTIERVLAAEWSHFARAMERGHVDIDWTGLKDAVERAVRRVVREQIAGKPTVVLMMQSPPVTTRSTGETEKQTVTDELVKEVQAATRQRKRRSAAVAAS